MTVLDTMLARAVVQAFVDAPSDRLDETLRAAYHQLARVGVLGFFLGSSSPKRSLSYDAILFDDDPYGVGARPVLARRSCATTSHLAEATPSDGAQSQIH